MKKKLLGVLFILSSISFSVQNLRFEMLEKNNTNIKIILRPDDSSPAQKESSTQKNDVAGTKRTYYVVRRGDTLNKISRKFGVSVENLVEMNGIVNPAALEVGQKLLIKEEKVVKEEPVYLDTDTEYTVKKGDTLFKIARKYGITTSHLMTANNLRAGSTLKVGQKLAIPSKKEYSAQQNERAEVTKNEATIENISSATQKIYIVKRGDTIRKISRVFGVDPDEIIEINNLGNGNSLEVNQKLIIPIKKIETSSVSSKTETRVYIVKRGDTLYKISRRFDVSVDDIIRNNGLSENATLEVNQKLIIPIKKTETSSVSSKTKTRVYIVKHGDTLYKISRRFGVSVDDIIRDNGLNENATLEVNQRLIIK